MKESQKPSDPSHYDAERSKREKADKVERFRHLNPFVQKGKIVFAGSSLMEQFPIHELLEDLGLRAVIYNRGVGGFTTSEMAEVLDECIFDLEPSHLFLNIGTNDLNGPDYVEGEMLARYEAILQQIKERMPKTKLYLLAYYPVNPTVAEHPALKELFRHRTNERIHAASEGVRELATRYGAQFLNVNAGLTDEAGNLRADITVEGMHMYANGYRIVLENLLPTLREIPAAEGGLGA